MPRPLVLGNGQILAMFDKNLEMRDFTYPFVGMEDHTRYGDRHRVGVWVEEKGLKWFDDPSWTISVRYKPDTLVGESLLRNDALGIEMLAEDQVHPVHNILLRRFYLKSTDGTEKRVRMFFHHDLSIYGDKQKDTAFYEPYSNTVIHYRQTRYFLIGGISTRPTESITGTKGGRYASVLHTMENLRTCGLASFAVGKSNYQGFEGTWRDAEDGVLGQHAIEQGSVDSTVAVHASVPAGEQTEISVWLCAGRTLEEVLKLHDTVMMETPERIHRNCANYWKSWAHKTPIDFGSLDRSIEDLYVRSLLTIRTHADQRGGIVAAADSDIMAFNRDTYTYVWPRDGAFVTLALDQAGYSEVTRRFFEFCAAVQTPDGYLLHKYNPDLSLGSSWHPWYRDGRPQLPIQEDETALVIYALWKHFERGQDFEFLQIMFERFVRKAAQFLCDFREEATGLPMASYDPWEEHRGIFTYTTACVIAGLTGAAHIAHTLGHHTHSERFQTVADSMKQAMLFHLYDETSLRFLKKIKRRDGKTVERDPTPDMSIAAIWKLGVLAPFDPRVVSTMRQLRSALTVHTPIGGIARYPHDVYHAQREPTSDVPGNPWIITTLWNAQWGIALAKTPAELELARSALAWTQRYASSTGILAEQLDPYTGSPLSVAPLTWSHAVFVETVLMFIAKEKEIQEKK
ncbi:MAG: glycoside hydrolase family 15 protein [Candidatus Peregrinibacteria bacterium]